MRTKGVKGGDADLTHIHEAITLAQAAPELITARLWAWLESGSRYEAVRRAMPTGAKWFIPTSARMPYDAALRMQHVGKSRRACRCCRRCWRKRRSTTGPRPNISS